MEKTLISRFQYGNHIYSLYELNYGSYVRYGMAHSRIWDTAEEIDSNDAIYGSFPENDKERVFHTFGKMLLDCLEVKND